MWEVAGSIIGQMMAQGEYDKIDRLRQEAMQRFGNTSLSSLEALAKERLGPSQLGGVKMDSNYKSTQDAALKKLMGLASNDGMDAQAMNQLNEAKQTAFGVERGMSGRTNQDLAQRGMLNSGAQVAGALSGQQAGQNAEYQGSLKTAASASERALQALIAGGGMSERMGANDLAQKNRAAGANDRIAEFNLKNSRDAEQGIVDDKLRIAEGMNGVGNQQAGDAANAAQRKKDMAQGIGRAAGTGWDYAKGSSGGTSGAQNTPAWQDPYGDPNEWEDPYRKKD